MPPSFGDLVNVRGENNEVIARGVVNITPGRVTSGYGIDTTYAQGFSSTDETFLSGIAPEQVELVEEAYGQKFQKRVFGH